MTMSTPPPARLFSFLYCGATDPAKSKIVYGRPFALRPKLVTEGFHPLSQSPPDRVAPVEGQVHHPLPCTRLCFRLKSSTAIQTGHNCPSQSHGALLLLPLLRCCCCAAATLLLLLCAEAVHVSTHIGVSIPICKRFVRRVNRKKNTERKKPSRVFGFVFYEQPKNRL